MVLPSKLTVSLKSSLVLNESLVLDGASCKLIIGNNAIEVYKGGFLSLHNTTVTGSFLERAMTVMGDARIVRMLAWKCDVHASKHACPCVQTDCAFIDNIFDKPKQGTNYANDVGGTALFFKSANGRIERTTFRNNTVA